LVSTIKGEKSKEENSESGAGQSKLCGKKYFRGKRG
jgi:hypothetical protein